MGSNIYIGNIAFSSTEDELREMFARHGAVISVKLINDRITGKPRGFGFAEMADEAGATAAIAALNGAEVGGRQLRVSAAREKERGERPPRRD
ncbi:MAG: RNA-binding protein [Planctomycetota bacterium]